MRRVRSTIVEAQNQYVFSACVCGFPYPACKAHGTYCIFICGLPDCTIFFNIIPQNVRFSKKKLLNTKCVLLLSLQRFFFLKHFSF